MKFILVVWKLIRNEGKRKKIEKKFFLQFQEIKGNCDIDL